MLVRSEIVLVIPSLNAMLTGKRFVRFLDKSRPMCLLRPVRFALIEACFILAGEVRA